MLDWERHEKKIQCIFIPKKGYYCPRDIWSVQRDCQRKGNRVTVEKVKKVMLLPSREMTKVETTGSKWVSRGAEKNTNRPRFSAVQMQKERVGRRGGQVEGRCTGKHKVRRETLTMARHVRGGPGGGKKTKRCVKTTEL